MKYPENIIPSVGEISVKFRNSMNDIKDSIRKMKERDVRYFSLHTQEPYTRDKIVKNSINKNPSSIVVKDNLVNIRGSPKNRSSLNQKGKKFSKKLEELIRILK